MRHWNNFDDLEEHKKEYSIIPRDTIAKVRMTIVPGQYNDETRNWKGGYATRHPKNGSVYLRVKFVVLEGPYIHRQILGMIGLHSDKGPKWAEMGSAFIKSILSSYARVSLYDNSDIAKNLRKTNSFADLDGLEFLARIDVELDEHGVERNAINKAITCDHKDYSSLMGQALTAKASAPTPAQNALPAPRVTYSQDATSSTQEGNTPAWMR